MIHQFVVEFLYFQRRNLPETCSPASTLSVESSTDLDSSPDLAQDLTPRLPRLKRTKALKHRPKAKKIALSAAQDKPTDVNLKSFKFPISADITECVKKGQPVPDEQRCQLIRECVTCLKAEYGEVIPNDAFKMASKMICADVPVLKDVEPPSWPEDVKFEYWVSSVSSPSYTLKMSRRISGSSCMIHNEQCH